MMKFDFSNQTAIITGASRGIGRAIAELLLKQGCRTIITGAEKPIPEWIKTIDGGRYYYLNFLDKESVVNFTSKISSLDKVDILVNNAEIHIPQKIDDIDDKSWDKIININLTGAMILTRTVMPKMRKVKKGKIVNISSIAALVPKPGAAAYAVSKGGLLALTRASALDTAGDNILINALCPGTTQTEMVEAVLSEKKKKEFLRGVPLGRFAKPEEIAEFVLFLCSEMNTYITGQSIVVDGGVSAQ